MMFRVLFLLFCCPINLLGQGKTPAGNRIVSDHVVLEKEIRLDPFKALLDPKSLIPSMQYDLKYASKLNFSGIRVYPRSTRHTYLRQQPAQALAAVATELDSLGIHIKIWDAYRPYAVTQRFWELIRDERYVANPATGSGHNRGIAVDLTLVDAKTGKELDMPTGFDDFSVAAHHGNKELEPKRVANRELLCSTMVRHGFIPLDTEWWHYYWPGAERYDVLNIRFKKLRALQRRLQRTN